MERVQRSSNKWFAWISPSGEVFPCAYGEHYGLISQLLNELKEAEYSKLEGDNDDRVDLELLWRTDDYAIGLGWVKVMAVRKVSDLEALVVTNNKMWNSTKEKALWEFTESLPDECKSLADGYKKTALDMAEYL